MPTNPNRVAIVQDMTTLQIRLVGPGAMARIAEINESHDLQCLAAYYMDLHGMSQRRALRVAWRQLKLETVPT